MKSEKTNLLEKLLFSYFYITRGERVALEVNTVDLDVYNRNKQVVFGKRVDLLSLKGKTFTSVEIKISKSDFKSNCGHNFCGQKNYYAVPPELADYACENKPEHVGVLTWKERKASKDKIIREIYVYSNAKKVKGLITNDQLRYYGSKYTIEEYQKQMMFTALNSTVRRLMSKIYIGESND